MGELSGTEKARKVLEHFFVGLHNVDRKRLKDEAGLQDIVCDSFSWMELVMELEAEYPSHKKKITAALGFDSRDIAHFDKAEVRTYGGLVEYLAGLE